MGIQFRIGVIPHALDDHRKGRSASARPFEDFVLAVRRQLADCPTKSFWNRMKSAASPLVWIDDDGPA